MSSTAARAQHALCEGPVQPAWHAHRSPPLLSCCRAANGWQPGFDVGAACPGIVTHAVAVSNPSKFVSLSATRPSYQTQLVSYCCLCGMVLHGHAPGKAVQPWQPMDQQSPHRLPANADVVTKPVQPAHGAPHVSSGHACSPPEALRSAALAGVWGAGGGSRGMKVGAAHRCPTSVDTVSFSEPASLSSMTASRPIICPELAWKHPAVSTGELRPLQRHKFGPDD